MPYSLCLFKIVEAKSIGRRPLRVKAGYCLSVVNSTASKCHGPSMGAGMASDG